MPIHETLKGNGRLVSRESPSLEHEVEYEFHISARIVKTGGLPEVAADFSSRGRVRPLDGAPLALGEYTLHAEDGEILRVKNVGAAWVILAS
jgi:hypothetical protein